MTSFRPRRSSRRSRVLAAGLLACVAVGLWWATHPAEKTAHGTSVVGATGVADPRRLVRNGGAKADGEEVMAAPAARPTRAEAVATVRALYRKEQLARELDLAQRRYEAHYWESECAGPALASIEQARAALVRQLSAEANQVLGDLFPGETGEVIVLAPFFDTDRAGPNLSALSAEARRRFEARLLAEPATWFPIEAGSLLELATQILPPGELAVYRQWNAPAAAALRRQLIGFEATEAEFNAILAETSGPSASGEPTVAGNAEASLANRLGAERFAAWRQQVSPEWQTALQDLQRLGLPLAQAGWLVAVRAEATASVQQAWRDATLAEWAKPARVARLQTDYAQAIAARLSLGADVSLDELNPAGVAPATGPTP